MSLFSSLDSSEHTFEVFIRFFIKIFFSSHTIGCSDKHKPINKIIKILRFQRKTLYYIYNSYGSSSFLLFFFQTFFLKNVISVFFLSNCTYIFTVNCIDNTFSTRQIVMEYLLLTCISLIKYFMGNPFRRN